MIKAQNIIFDLDGVLIHSEHLHAKAKQLTLEKYDIFFEDEYFDQFNGRTDHAFFEVVKEAFPRLPSDFENLFREKREIYKTLVGELTAVPGAKDFLNFLKEKNMRLGVVTSSDTFYQTIAFDFLEINSQISLVVNADMVSSHKPDPAPYKKMIELLNDPLDKTFVIEDSPSGIKSAKGAGLFVIGLTTSFTAKVLLEAGADKTVDSYEELKKRLE